MEFNYRRDLKKIEELELLEKEYEEVKEIYKEMVKRNLVEETNDKYKKVENFKKFMEVTTVESLEQEYYKVAYRQANVKKLV